MWGLRVHKHRLAAAVAIAVSVTTLSQTSAFAAGSDVGTPTNLATFPTPLTLSGAAQTCGTGTAYVGLENIGGAPGVVLSATLNSGPGGAANHSAAFDVTDKTTGTVLAPIDSAGMGGPGTTVSVDLPVTDGHAYAWTVAETDGTTWSNAAGPCDFVSDTTAPLSPTVTSTDFPTAGGGLQSGEAGSFTLTSSDPAPATGTGSGFKGYIYSFDSAPSVGGTVVPPNGNGSLVISGQSFSWGTHTLYAQAEDNAGNVSGVTQYSFYVAQSPELSPKLNLQAEPIGVLADGSGSTGLWPITSCTYDFGDKTPTETRSDCGVSVLHEYSKLGTYPVTLTITDKYGNQKSVTKSYTTPGLSKGTLYQATLNSTTWVSGWASPAGSTNFAQSANTALPDGSSQLVGVTTSGALEHNIHYANGSWQGWHTVPQTGVTVTDASIAGMPNGSSQIIEITSTGVLKHDIRNANGSWQASGWGSPAGSTGIAQASITALPNGDSQLVAVTTSGTLEHNIRHANGSWQGWHTLAQPGVTVTNASIAGMPNGSSQIIEITSTGVLKHNVRNANGSWQSTGWGSPSAASEGGPLTFVQATIAAMPDGSTHLLAVDSNGIVENTVRYANGSWTNGWGQIAQTVHVIRPANVSIAGMPNGDIQIVEVSAI
jgi:hypothetical protein